MNSLQVNEARHVLFHHKVTKQALIPNRELAHIPIETFLMLKELAASHRRVVIVIKTTSATYHKMMHVRGVQICNVALVINKHPIMLNVLHV